MVISEVRLTRLQNDSKVLAIGSITLDKCFVVDGVKVMSGTNGYFVSMPSRKKPNGEYKDVCYPITKEFRQQITEAVLSKLDDLENYMPENGLPPIDYDPNCPF